MIHKSQKKQTDTLRHQVFLIALAAAVMLYGSFLLAQLLILRPLSVMPDSGWKQLCSAYLPFLPVFLSVNLFTRFAEPEIFTSFAPSKKNGMQGNTGRAAIMGLVAGTGLNLCCAVVPAVHGDYSLAYNGLYPLFMVLAFTAVLLQSAAEELLFRGYVMGALRERYGPVFAVLVNPLLFMLAHTANSGVTPVSLLTAYVFGFCLSILLYSLDSIWFVILAHAGWNFTQNLLLGLPNSGLVVSQSVFRLNPGAVSGLWYDTAFGLEGSITPIFLWPLLTFVIVLLRIRKSKQ